MRLDRRELAHILLRPFCVALATLGATACSAASDADPPEMHEPNVERADAGPDGRPDASTRDGADARAEASTLDAHTGSEGGADGAVTGEPDASALADAEAGDGDAGGQADDAPGTTEQDAGYAELVAFRGGSSIALRWSVIGEGAFGVDSWAVYRDGKQIATVLPGFHPDFPEKDGKGYVDHDIAPGATYAYRVQSTGRDGTLDVGPALTVTAPAWFSPPPNVLFDTSKASDLAALSVSAKAFLEIWWPKVAFAVAFPDYTPLGAYTIRFDPNYTGVAYADGSVPEIVVNPKWSRDHPQDFGMFLHESTHLLDKAKDMPGWIVEGLADWSREYLLHDRDPSPVKVNQHYTQGYSVASYFLNWIQDTYGVPMIRTLTIAGHAGTYSPKLFVQLTGKTIGKLWEELTGQKERDPGPLRFESLTNKCVDGAGGRARIATCTSADSQQWTWGAREANDGSIYLSASHGDGNWCLDVQSSGTTQGTPVGTYPCNGTGAQSWKVQPDGSLKNPQSGYCLDDPGTSTVDGTGLQIWECNGTAAQRFTLPQ